MSLWLKLDSSRYAGGRDVTLRGSTYRELNSPYDIPEGIRAQVDDSKHQLTIEFQYLTDDTPSPTAVTAESGMQVFTGEKTGRVMKIVAHAQGSLDAAKVIEIIAQHLRGQKGVRASDITSDVLSDNRGLLSVGQG